MVFSTAVSLLVVADLLQFTGVILLITSLATPCWMTFTRSYEYSDPVISTGLFTYSTGEDCEPLSDIPWIRFLTIAAAVFGCLATLIGVIFIVHLMRHKKLERLTLSTSAGVNGMISGILISFTCIYYKANIFEDYSGTHLGYSFYLSVGSLSAIFIGSFMVFVGINRLKVYFITQSLHSNGIANVAYIG